MVVSGCGILPICMINNELYLLCGVENNGQVTDLGGRIESNENTKQCAAREFYEESVGLVMPYNELLQCKVYRKIKLGKNKYYMCLIIKIDYINVEHKYNNLLKYIKKNKSKPIDINPINYNIKQLYKENVYPKGFFELEELKWIKFDDLKNNKYPLRGRFRGILNKLQQ